MNLSAWSIRNPLIVLVLFFVLTVAGLATFHAMRVQNQPDMDLPVVTIAASLPGATPGQLENEVARKIENALINVQGVRHVDTTISEGTVSLAVQFRLEKPLQEALDEVRSAVQGARAELPSAVPDPVISKVELASLPVLAFTVQSDTMDTEALSWYVDDALSRKLLALPGVGKITRVGGVDRQIQVDLDPHRIRALGITVSDIAQQLDATEVESGSGTAELSDAEHPLRLIARAKDAAALERVSLSITDGRRVMLSDIAVIRDTTAKRKASAWMNDREVIGFEVSRTRDAGEIEVGRVVRDTIAQLEKAHPDLKFTESLDLVSHVQGEYDASMRLLYEGALLAVLVVWFFLREWRATFIAAVALPLSILPAFAGMYLLGFSLNSVTLLALSLVVGLLVDDAIVEVENIVRHLRMGKTPWQAAMEATEEIGLPVVATTFALIAVFLPTALMSGVVGRFFAQFGWTAVLAVFASLVVARMLTPLMAAYLLRPLTDQPEEPRWLRAYMRCARWALQHRFQTLLYAILLFIGSLGLISFLKTSFIPPDDNDQTQVTLTLPPGASIEQTERSAQFARQLLMQNPHIESIYTTVGANAFSGAGTGASASINQAVMIIRMKPRAQRPVKQDVEAAMRELVQRIPGVRASIGLGGAANQYVLSVSGSDEQRLTQAVRQIETALRALPTPGAIRSTEHQIQTEIIVRPHPEKAAAMGVSPQAISDTLRLATQGNYEQSLPKLNLDTRQVSIVTRLASEARNDLEALKRITVRGNNGPVMIGEVASLELGGGPSVITRHDRQRNIKLEIDLGDRGLGEMASQIDNLPILKQLPAGVQIQPAGDAELMQETFTGFGLAMIAGILCIYLVLLLLFRDVFHPVTILSALPLAIGGSFAGLLLGGHDLSMPALIGLIMLMGIVAKNSILLVEYTIVARRNHGMSRWDALLDACHKRARPIIMTTVAMGAGMVPIIIGSDSVDSSFRAPMALAVFGGLITSTALSLLVVPAVFTYVDNMKQCLMRSFLKITNKLPRTKNNIASGNTKPDEHTCKA